RGNDSLRLARRVRPAAAGRSGRKAGGSALGAWPFAAGADRHARAGSATGRRLLSCLPDAGGGVRQFAVWGRSGATPTRAGTSSLRSPDAHSPTERAALQTAVIARRLMRGGELHQGAEPS